MNTIIELKNVVKMFDGVTAVNNLSCTVERGTITGIIGPNGSGKTTLINLLSGTLQTDGGSMRFGDSAPTARMRAHEAFFRGISRTFQNVRLFEQMTVSDNIMVVLTDRRVTRALFAGHGTPPYTRAEKVLRRMGLWEKRHHLAGELSYGQRKLLEIARVFATDTDIYLLDEPFAGLFPEMVRIVSDAVRTARAEGKTVILIEHAMDLIRSLCDHVIMMDEGILLAEGPPDDVLARREVIEAYVGQ